MILKLLFTVESFHDHANGCGCSGCDFKIFLRVSVNNRGQAVDHLICSALEVVVFA